MKLTELPVGLGKTEFSAHPNSHWLDVFTDLATAVRSPGASPGSGSEAVALRLTAALALAKTSGPIVRVGKLLRAIACDRRGLARVLGKLSRPPLEVLLAFASVRLS